MCAKLSLIHSFCFCFCFFSSTDKSSSSFRAALESTSSKILHNLLKPREPCDECLSSGFPAPFSLASWFSGAHPPGGGSGGGFTGSVSSVESMLSSSSRSELRLLGAGTGALRPLRLEPKRLPGPLSSKTSTPVGGVCWRASSMVFNLLIGTRERDEDRGDTPESWRWSEIRSTSPPPPRLLLLRANALSRSPPGCRE